MDDVNAINLARRALPDVRAGVDARDAGVPL